MALAGLMGEGRAPGDASLRDCAGFLAEHFVDDLLTHPDRYNDWRLAMLPARAVVIGPLSTVFRDPGRSESARSLAATILASFAGDDPKIITELLLDATDRQYPVILNALSGYRPSVSVWLARLIQDRPPADSGQEERTLFARRQANAAIGLLHWGDPDRLWPLLRQSPEHDPLLRTYLVERLARLTPDPLVLLDRFQDESEVSVRRAIVLVIGGIAQDQQSPSWAGPAADWLLELVEHDPDAGIHSAAEWALRKWEKDGRLASATAPLATRTPPAGQFWQITANGHTMAILPGNIRFRMGAATDESDRDGDEKSHTRLILRTFAISTTEVTGKQFTAFDPSFDRFPNRNSPHANGPINAVTWLDAIAYCRWLSEQEGITEDQMCYPPRDQIKDGMKPYPDYLSRTGFRLPTEAEWEYACRAGASSTRFFGDDVKMLSRYAWFIRNGEGRAWPVGRLLPNEFGLFDILGNVREWCHDIYDADPTIGPDREDQSAFDPALDRVARGGSYVDQAYVVRTANRYHAKPEDLSFGTGFRIARTIPAPR